MNNFVYKCKYVTGSEVTWSHIPGVTLVDNVSGELPHLSTIVKMCRTDEYVHVRFECADDYVLATYEQRDDPLYKEDVVEMFIDESGKGSFYKEIELSPRNVVFDALIHKEPGVKQKVDASWDLEGLLTNVVWPEEEHAIYEMAFPLSAFKERPKTGTTWRINWYRIDNSADGQRYYWAWAPTGEPRNFHVPEKFGTLVFL